MTYPKLIIDLKKIERNTREMVKRCQSRGINVAGVTKMVCGNEVIGNTIVDAGVEILAMSEGKTILGIADEKLPHFCIIADYRGRHGFLRINDAAVCSFSIAMSWTDLTFRTCFSGS